VLHALVLLWLFAAAQPGSPGSRSGLQLVPVDVVEVDADTILSTTTRADAPQQPMTSPSQSASTTQDAAGLDGKPPTGEPEADQLEAQIEALAKLRQEDADRPTENGLPLSSPSATGDASTLGLGDDGSVEDFIRAQVERHWHLDVASLATSQFSVPIRVEITSGGIVTKAEIIDSPHGAEPGYQQIALSARNAVLLASPLTLPAGHYQASMDLVLYLDPRDALR
jgi:hypothetical protein